MEEIRLNYEIGKFVRQALSKKFKDKPAPPKIPNAYNYNETFSKEEIEAITSLEVFDVEITLADLTKLPNLKQLSLKSSQNSSNTLTEDNIKILQNLPLEVLEIDGYNGLSTFDFIDYSEKLWSVSLTNCLDLTTIKNIPCDLSSFRCIGNHNLKNIYSIVGETLEAFASNITNISDWDLDVSFAPELFKQLSQKQKRYTKSDLDVIAQTLKFGEEISRRIYIHNFGQIKTLQDKVAKISQDIIPQNATDLEKFSILYKWICENIKYDYAGLESSYRRHKSESFVVEGKPMNLAIGEKFGTNNYLNGILFGTCVCEGFSKTLQYMSIYNGLKTNLVLCHAGENPDIKYDHSIMQYEDGAQTFFCDITWDASRYQKGLKDFKYFMLSEEDMSIDHKDIKTLSNRKQKTDKTISTDTKQSLLKNL